MRQVRSDDNISRIKNGKILDAKKALIIFDEKEINYEQLDEINPNEMAVISISKNANTADLKKYGKKPNLVLYTLKALSMPIKTIHFIIHYSKKKVK